MLFKGARPHIEAQPSSLLCYSAPRGTNRSLRYRRTACDVHCCVMQGLIGVYLYFRTLYAAKCANVVNREQEYKNWQRWTTGQRQERKLGGSWVYYNYEIIWLPVMARNSSSAWSTMNATSKSKWYIDKQSVPFSVSKNGSSSNHLSET